MYYPSYEDYMKDLFYFNGLSNPNNMYCLGNSNNSNLNNMYQSIYNIVNPVIQKVISGNNYQFVNEESVNNIVDVVIGITAGDINNMDSANNETRKNCNSNNCSNSNSQSNTSNNSLQETNTLLRDLIKILTIKELSSRNNVRRFPYTYGAMSPYYMNNQMMPYMIN